jgi:hypothetical protein
MANKLSVVPFAVDAKSEDTLRDPVFNVDAFALVKFKKPKTLVVKSVFETHRFPRIFTFAPDRPIGFETKIEDKFEVTNTLRVVTRTFVVAILLETYTFPDTSKVFPVGPIPAPIFETKLRVKTFPVLTFDEFKTKFVVDKALETQTFPDTSSVFPVGPVPILVFDTKTSEKVFMIPETFERPVKTFVVVRAFEAERFGVWTELTKRTDAFVRVTFEPPEKRFPKGTKTFPIVEEAVPATIFPKVVVVP